jgi:hypothetical protein
MKQLLIDIDNLSGNDKYDKDLVFTVQEDKENAINELTEKKLLLEKFMINYDPKS